MGEVVTFERKRRREPLRPGGEFGKGRADRAKTAFFSRVELHKILQLYSRKVMAGEWRDYAIGGDERSAVFAIYGHASHVPIYRIAKRPKSQKRPGGYQVIAGNRVLDSQPSLDALLRAMDTTKPRLVVKI